ncbi:MAG: RluA family pseudouridine synthase [Actinomycetota bacterium]|nr:RluA family pseudouridine synthase [Actinomycetota bacterium]
MNESVRVPAALAGERVDSAVALLTGWSRADVQTLLSQHAVLVDGATVSKSHRLREGEVIELLEEPAPAVPPQPEPDVDVPVRYEDADVVVVAKPAGLVVHPGAGNDTGTLVHGLLARYPEIATVGDRFRPGIVHRLDRETSGLLVVARSERAYDNLVEQLGAHTVERRYGALVWGHLATARGMIDAPIGRSEARRTRMAVRDAGRPARTGYEVHETFETPICSRLECRLETGRTHQIRVHLTAIGHPVVGDGSYGGLRDSIALSRPFLHAAVLGFVHPVSGENLRFKEPLPDELEDVLAALRADAR